MQLGGLIHFVGCFATLQNVKKPPRWPFALQAMQRVAIETPFPFLQKWIHEGAPPKTQEAPASHMNLKTN